MHGPPFNSATVVVMDLRLTWWDGDRWWILSPLERPVCLSQIIGRHRENQDKSYQNPFKVPRIQNKIDVEWCRDIEIGQTTNIHSSTNLNSIKIMFSIAFRCTFWTKTERERERKKNLMCTVYIYIYLLYMYIFFIYVLKYLLNIIYHESHESPAEEVPAQLQNHSWQTLLSAIRDALKMPGGRSDSKFPSTISLKPSRMCFACGA